LFAARGSSDNAAIYGRYLLETHAGVLAGLVSPSVATHYRSRLDLSDDVVVGVSQSGRTREIVATMAWARDCGALTVAVSNDADSELATSADLVLTTVAGVELAVPATKSYLTQVAAMAVLGTALGPDDPVLDAALAEIPDRVAAVLADTARLDAVVEQLSDGDSPGGGAGPRAAECLVTGRGLLMGTALEAALKLEETCARPVRGYSYADLRHGPISAVREGVTAVLVGAADGPLADAMTDLALDLRARGATTVAVGGSPALVASCDLATGPIDVTERLAPLVTIVPMQVVIERLARRLGLDPDEPRGLSKITRTDTQEES
jgi:glucosamine--fructose-6-phosphate aminotransferase (isomerizing)